MKRPSVNDCLDELRRVKAENERLNRLVQTQRPELDKLRRVEVLIRELAYSLASKAAIVGELQGELVALIGTNEDDLPSFDELLGIISDGRDRVDAALSTLPNGTPARSAVPASTSDK